MGNTGGPCFACGKTVDYGTMIHPGCKKNAMPRRRRRVMAGKGEQ